MMDTKPCRRIGNGKIRRNPLKIWKLDKSPKYRLTSASFPARYGCTSNSVIVRVDVTAEFREPSSQLRISPVSSLYAGFASM